MKLITQQDLADKLGISKQTVHAAVTSGQLRLMLHENTRYINLSDERNKTKLDYWKEKYGIDTILGETPAQKDDKNKIADLDRKIKEANLKAKLAAIETEKLRQNKLRGESLPIDLVSGVITLLSKQIVDTFYTKSKAFVDSIVHENKLSSKAKAKLNKSLIDFINASNSTAIESAKAKVIEISKHVQEQAK